MAATVPMLRRLQDVDALAARRRAATHVWLGRERDRHEHRRRASVSHAPGCRYRTLRRREHRSRAHSGRGLSRETRPSSPPSNPRAERIDLCRRPRRDPVGYFLARKRWLVDIARSNADSGLESILRLRLHYSASGSTAKYRSPAWATSISSSQACSSSKSTARRTTRAAKRHRDLVRDADRRAPGYETLRFDYSMVIYDWPTVERAMLARLDARLKLLIRRCGVRSRQSHGSAARGHQHHRSDALTIQTTTNTERNRRGRTDSLRP